MLRDATSPLTAKPREVEALSQLITRVNSSLDVSEVLDHAIEVCAELTHTEGALVYLWEEEQRRLVVRGAVEGYRHSIGTFGLELGEGLTGWTALTRRLGIIRDEPLADPRYKNFPELNDERFQSVVTVPIVGRQESLVGVLTLHTRAPHEFTDEDVTLLETIASLVAGAVENARLHEQALRSMEVFRSLADLSRRMTATAGAPETLQRLALTALELLDAELVAVLRLDEPRSRLTVETWVGRGRAAVRADAVPAEGLWSRLLGGGPASVRVSPDDALVRELGIRAEPRSLFAAPLVFEAHPIGLLCCYATEQRSLGVDNLELLGTIANHAAIALEESRLRTARDGSPLLRDLFDAIRAGDRDATAVAAGDLGLKLDQPHAVAVVETELSDGHERLWIALENRLADRFPGSVCDGRGRSLVALIPVRSEPWAELLEETLGAALEDASAKLGREIAGGFSDRASRPEDYALAFRQARMAAAIAHSSGSGRRARGFAGLGAQRYLWTISQERDPDPLELAVHALLERDRERGSDLFRTLEVYLDHQGNARRTAAVLYIHRNTLRQRLRRIREIVDLDPTDPSVWFDLSLAVRLIRFRELGRDQ